MRQSNIIHNLFHFSLHLLLWQAFQTGVEPDVFLNCQPELNIKHLKYQKTRIYNCAKT